MANFINKICGVTSTGIRLVSGDGYNKINSVMDNRYSVDLDGTNDYINASTSAGDLNTTTGSFAIWVKSDAGSNNDNMWQCSVGTSADDKIGCVHNTGADVIRFFYKADGTQVNADHSITEGALISAGWTHVAGTWDAGVADILRLYINGAASGTVTTIGDFSGTPDILNSGKAANNDSTYWDGHLDNLALWTSVLTAAEITAIYNGRNIDFTQAYTDAAGNTYDSHGDLIQWLRMLENTGTSLADSSGNSNTGTLVNGTAWAADPAF